MSDIANDNSKSDRWSRYYEATQVGPPRDTLLKALAAFEAEPPTTASRFAIDLGSGVGRDSFELLRRGWRVEAIDGEPEALARIQVAAPPGATLEAHQMTFEQITELPPAHLINASFSLPFCSPAYFPTLWTIIVDALLPGGRFAGQYFGVHDEWAGDPNMNFHTRSAVETLLTRFTIEHLEEVDQDGKTAVGETKHWHVFHIVARRL